MTQILIIQILTGTVLLLCMWVVLLVRRVWRLESEAGDMRIMWACASKGGKFVSETTSAGGADRVRKAGL